MVSAVPAMTSAVPSKMTTSSFTPSIPRNSRWSSSDMTAGTKNSSISPSSQLAPRWTQAQGIGQDLAQHGEQDDQGDLQQAAAAQRKAQDEGGTRTRARHQTGSSDKLMHTYGPAPLARLGGSRPPRRLFPGRQDHLRHAAHGQQGRAPVGRRAWPAVAGPPGAARPADGGGRDRLPARRGNVGRTRRPVRRTG
ncbi:hypothetical protein G6F57_013752 [Rhizopus arrhizus]|nr:hypothetical protein G6F57_013752 [Rhizopus arrhizus]